MWFLLCAVQVKTNVSIYCTVSFAVRGTGIVISKQLKLLLRGYTHGYYSSKALYRCRVLLSILEGCHRNSPHLVNVVQGRVVTPLVSVEPFRYFISIHFTIMA